MERQELIKTLDAYIGTHRDEILEDLKDLVRIPSVSNYCGGEKPFGEEVADVLDLALSKASERGFHTNNHGNWYGTAFLESKEPGSGLIGIFSHLDIVEPGEGWTYDPFEPVEKDGFLIGRGAADNKSAAVTGLYAMQIIRDLKLPVKSNVMLYFGTCEEKGMPDAEKFAKEHVMPDYSIVPDLYFPVCYGEKGGLKLTLQARRGFHQIISMNAGNAENMVPGKAVAKIRYQDDLYQELLAKAQSREDIRIAEEDREITVAAFGKGGHSSLPQGTVNAIHVLTDFMKDMKALDRDDRSFCSAMAGLSEDYYGKGLGINYSDEASGDLICSPVKLTMDGNIPCVLFNVRYPVTDYRERIEAEVINTIIPLGLALVKSVNNEPLYYAKEDPLVSRLTDLYNEVMGTQKKPFIIDGGTYARKLKNAVGFGGGNGTHAEFLPKGHGGVHQPDEARSIQAILDAIKIYVLAIMELDQMIRERTAESNLAAC